MIDSTTLSTADAAGDVAMVGNDAGTMPDAASMSDAAVDVDSAALRYRAAVLADKPIAYWRLNDQTGPVLKNEVDDTYRALYPGGAGAPQLGVPGVFGGAGESAMLFSRMGTLLVDSDAGNATFDFLGLAPFTFEAWVKPIDFGTTTTDTIFSNLDLAPTYAINTCTTFGFASDGLRSERWVQTYIWNFAASTAALGTDHFRHVVLTYDGDQEHIYVDGVVGSGGHAAGYANVDGGMVANSVPFTWGGLNGTLDELAVYDTALSSSQIVNHIAASAP